MNDWRATVALAGSRFGEADAEGGRDVALLERGARVELLLADLVGGDLPIVAEYQDVDPEELASLWAMASTLAPLITVGV